MNIFAAVRFIGKVWQDPNAAEVVKISSGQLYLVRPGNIRSSRECIYNDAMATIRRVPSVEHNFQLVITRVYEDGDQELLEDEDETDEERVFLISEELEFRTGETDGDPTFLWRDLDGDVDEFYEYYRSSADNTQDGDLEEFVWRPPVPKSKSQSRRKVAATTDNTLSESMKSLSVTESYIPPADTKPTEKQESSEQEPSFMSSMDDFDNQGIVTARVLQQKDIGYTYWLTASAGRDVFLAHRIASEMNQKWSHKINSLTWNHLADDGSQSSWLLRFANNKDFGSILQIFTQCLWQTLHQTEWGKAKPEEQRYVLSSAEDVEMKDVSDDEDDEEEVISELDPDEEASDDSEQEDEDEALPPALSKGDRNSQLTVGYKGDRSYVVRGNNIGVFNHAADNGVKYYATISKIATPKGKDSNQNMSVMLHDQDTKMVMMDSGAPNCLYSMDIERGKIVEEWKVHDDINVDHIAPDNKFAPTTREQTLMVESQYKQYVSKNKFSGVATTAAGKLAVASEKGDIRLFDSIGKNAKTALPPLGDPILGIDVTADGRYIVATTKTYLLLIDTLIGEGRYAGQLGFDRSFPATSKPIPRRLQLRAEHVAYMGHGISFTPARFNQGEGQEENAIVTSTGQFVIAWDFAKVKKGHLDKYEIKKYEDHVVQDNFKFGDDKEIIVALDNNVLAINKKNLKKPTRHSLAAPLGTIPSRSNIVNAPY
ncbi:VID27 cytoplasmic protein-domain-containing protein [Cyathus striatus]|nr:VID27 cytoplasmic protein-domain-containing protein [Cyathus striatus]